MTRTIALLFLFAMPAAYAEPWLCTDADGNKAWSYDPASAASKSCIHRPIPSSNVWRARPRNDFGERPASFPTVDAKTQEKRDASRRQILEQELAREKKSLAEAMSALAEQQRAAGAARKAGVPDEGLRTYRERVRVHLTNIANLEKELGLDG
jgi:hypothetical protein